MLYDRWRQVAGQRRSDLALNDLTTDRRWTFGELLDASDRIEVPTGPLVFPQGHQAEFVFEVLRGWRHQRVVCPLEPAQPTPQVLPPPENIIHLKTTSATTGAPRLVAFTAEQIAADPRNIALTMGLRPDWPNLGVISLAHSYGFSNLVLPLLLDGIPLLLAGSALPEAVRRAAGSEPALTLAAVPALWRAWLDADAIPPNIRLAISAGAPLAPEIERAVFTHHGLKIHNFYGATECGGIAYDDSESPRSDGSDVGCALANVTLEVADTGCLTVHGAAVGESYWPEPGDDLGNNRFQTSDLATLQDRRLFLRGRAGDLINVAGRKVAPETIERALAACPGVRQCVVLGVPAADDARTESILACVSGEAGSTAEGLRDFLLARLPSWQVPREWWFVPALEANERGKLSRADWRRRFLAQRGAQLKLPSRSDG